MDFGEELISAITTHLKTDDLNEVRMYIREFCDWAEFVIDGVEKGTLGSTNKDDDDSSSEEDDEDDEDYVDEEYETEVDDEGFYSLRECDVKDCNRVGE